MADQDPEPNPAPVTMPTGVYTGEFTLLGISLKVHVLDNGLRLIDADSMAALIAKMNRLADLSPEDRDTFETDLVAFGRYLAQLPAQPSKGD